jgi:anti-sigma B factor antagonist
MMMPLMPGPCMAAVFDPDARGSILPVEGTLRAPVTPKLRQRIEALRDRGERRVVLDLAHLSAIDAAGIGELMRVFTTMRAAGGVLRVARPSRRVRKLLHITGVYTLLHPGAES